jgi:hypothetical protein
MVSDLKNCVQTDDEAENLADRSFEPLWDEILPATRSVYWCRVVCILCTLAKYLDKSILNDRSILSKARKHLRKIR